MEDFSKFHFKDIEDGDEILHVYHRNWFYLFQQFFMMFLMLIVFVGAFLYLPLIFPDAFDEYHTPILFFENIMMLAFWIFSFMIWIDYYFDVWIITSQRIVNVEQKGLFTRKVSELRYEKIQDVTTEVSGFIPTIINYGDVQIQTAGEDEEFMFRTVSDPYKIKSIIVELQRKNETSSTEELGEMIKEKISGE